MSARVPSLEELDVGAYNCIRYLQQFHDKLRTDLAFKTFCTTGMQYAAVFPLPVRARASISLFSRAKGMAFVCTRVGRANPNSARARRSRASRILENEANVAFWSTRRASGIEYVFSSIFLAARSVLTIEEMNVEFRSSEAQEDHDWPEIFEVRSLDLQIRPRVLDQHGDKRSPVATPTEQVATCTNRDVQSWRCGAGRGALLQRLVNRVTGSFSHAEHNDARRSFHTSMLIDKLNNDSSK